MNASISYSFNPLCIVDHIDVDDSDDDDRRGDDDGDDDGFHQDASSESRLAIAFIREVRFRFFDDVVSVGVAGRRLTVSRMTMKSTRRVQETICSSVRSFART